MDHDEHALLAAVRDHPHDETPRLVLADYYDDNSMPHEAAYHRGVVASRRAHGMTQLAGEHIERHYGSLDGATFRRDHQYARQYSGYARGQLGDDPENHMNSLLRGGYGFVSGAASDHLTSSDSHTSAAYEASKAGDHELARLHRQAARAHTEARETLNGVGGINHSMYAPRGNVHTKDNLVRALGVHARTDSLTNRTTVTIRHGPWDSHESTTTHPAEFHAAHEALE